MQKLKKYTIRQQYNEITQQKLSKQLPNNKLEKIKHCHQRSESKALSIQSKLSKNKYLII